MSPNVVGGPESLNPCILARQRDTVKEINEMELLMFAEIYYETYAEYLAEIAL